MKIALKSIILAVPALSKLTGADLSLKLAYRLRKLIDALQKEADFFSEQRAKILNKYGVPDDAGEYAFSGDGEQKAIEELDALLDMEVTVELDALRVPISEKVALSVNDMINLAPFVEFIEEEN